MENNISILAVQLREAAQMIAESGNYPEIQQEWAQRAHYIAFLILTKTQDNSDVKGVYDK